jgi:hypothetical protein
MIIRESIPVKAPISAKEKPPEDAIPNSEGFAPVQRFFLTK